jgi:hypothetical protein
MWLSCIYIYNIYIMQYMHIYIYYYVCHNYLQNPATTIPLQLSTNINQSYGLPGDQFPLSMAIVSTPWRLLHVVGRTRFDLLVVSHLISVLLYCWWNSPCLFDKPSHIHLSLALCIIIYIYIDNIPSYHYQSTFRLV